MTDSRIIELARVISKHTSSIDDSLSARGLPKPSFDYDASNHFPPDLTTSFDAVLDATQELHDLLLAPMSLIQRKSSVRDPIIKLRRNFNTSSTIRWHV